MWDAFYAELSARLVDTVRQVGRHGDGNGLYLAVSDSGSKKWVLRYQHGGRRRDMGLGAFPDVSWLRRGKRLHLHDAPQRQVTIRSGNAGRNAPRPRCHRSGRSLPR